MTVLVNSCQLDSQGMITVERSAWSTTEHGEFFVSTKIAFVFLRVVTLVERSVVFNPSRPGHNR
jgi:hypothetical protein